MDFEDITFNLYDILCVNKDASKKDIKKAYNKLVLFYHPDKNNVNENEVIQIYEKIVISYNILSNCNKRALYDKHVKELNESKHYTGLKDTFNKDVKEIESLFIHKKLTQEEFENLNNVMNQTVENNIELPTISENEILNVLNNEKKKRETININLLDTDKLKLFQQSLNQENLDISTDPFYSLITNTDDSSNGEIAPYNMGNLGVYSSNEESQYAHISDGFNIFNPLTIDQSSIGSLSIEDRLKMHETQIKSLQNRTIDSYSHDTYL